MTNRNCEFCLKPGGKVCGIGYCHRHDAPEVERPMVFTSMDFNGLGGNVGAVAVANSRWQAEKLMAEALKERGLKFDGTLLELRLDKPKVRVLDDGDPG